MLKAALENIFDWLSPVMKVIGLLPVSGSPIFMFHRVLPEGELCYDSEMVTSPELFKGFQDWAEDHYQVVGLDELLKLRGKNNGGKPLCAITFDDGWRDVFLHAFPLLRERKMSATVFLPVRFVGTTRRFWQERIWFCFEELRRRNGAEDVLKRLLLQFPWYPPVSVQEFNFDSVRQTLLRRSSQEAEEFAGRLEEAFGPGVGPPGPAFMDWTQVKAMQEGGVTFGSHTLNHTLLTCSDPKTARIEIEESREELSGFLGAPMRGFSYPWGAADRRIREQVRKAGYTYAVTTATKLVRDSADSFSLPRVAIGSAFLRGRNLQFAPRRMDFHIARTTLHTNSARQSAAARLRPQGKLRVAFVIDFIDAWEDGGTEKQLKKLIEALDREYFEPELYFMRPSQGLTEKDFPCPVRVASPLPGPERSRVKVLFHLVQLFRRHRPHLVQTFFRDSTYYGVTAAWIARVPVIVISRRNAGYWKTLRDRIALKLMNRMADAWQCNSRATYESLRSGESVPGEKIEILPNAIDLEKFSAATGGERASVRKRLGLPGVGPVLVSVANLTPVKGVETLVKAAAAVCRDFPEAKFLVVGEGPLRSSLEDRIEKQGLNGAVRLVGAQSDVRTYLAAADIGLLTSRSEGSSNTLLEYMAIGLPAVVSDVLANRELVDEVLFEPGNPSDLARKILILWGCADLRERLRRDYRDHVSRYGQELIAGRAQSYYLRLAAERLPEGYRL